ncbi:MAG: hypothetical protein OXE99_04140 [Cellvibrionales bacterium]|nr:hypothetical protein [Cellvibrionales bacterium]
MEAIENNNKGKPKRLVEWLESKNLGFLTSTARFNKVCKRRFKKVVRVSRKKSFLYIVAIPWSLAALYYLIFSADQFVSNASFMIREANSSAQVQNQGVTLAAIAGFSSQSDEHILTEHIQSVDMLQHLESSLAMRAHFNQQAGIDFLARLSGSASQEDFLAYYQDLLEIYYNDLSGLLTVEIKSFDAAYSQQLLAEILVQSERLVNDKSLELANAQLDFVKAEIAASTKRLVAAREALVSFQDAHKIFSPEHQGQTVSSIISQLEAELATAEAEKRRLLAYQRSDSPQVVALIDKINSLRAQIQYENTRLVSEGDGNKDQTINELFGQYKALELELEVAQATYAAALKGLESARIEASRKLKHLLIINQPFVAEEALYPKKAYNLLTLAIILLLVFGLFRMLATTIKEHMD